MADFDIKELLDNYIEEMHELLDKFDANIVRLDKIRDDKPMINEIFRVVHSMKGMTATMGYTHTAELIHAMEDLLYDVRDGKMQIDDKAVELLLVCHDYIANVVSDIAETGEERKDARFGAIIEKLHKILEKKEITTIKANETAELDCELSEDIKKTLLPGEKLYKIKAYYEKTCMMKSVRGFMILQMLESYGVIIKSVPTKEFFSEGNKWDEDFITIIMKSKQTPQMIEKHIMGITEIREVEINENIEKSECRVSVKAEPANSFSQLSNMIEGDITEEMKVICGEIDEKLTVIDNKKKEIKLLNYFFKKFHTISGLAVMTDAKSINEISIKTEKYIDGVMKDKYSYSEETKELILNSCDYIFMLCAGEIDETNTELQFVLKNHLNNLVKGKLETENIEEIKKTAGNEKVNKSTNSGDKIGTILIEQGLLSTDEVVDIIVKQKESKGNLKFGEIALKDNKIDKAELEEALETQKTKHVQMISSFIKIPVTKVDGLVDSIGELMIIQAQIEQEAVALLAGNTLLHNITRMSRIIKELQYVSMSMRMVSVQPTFQKLGRIAHDTINELGKKVVVEFEGGDTEIDRNIADKIMEPLMHMVRNSISHGIESAEDRIDKGKEEEGKVKISAYSSKGDVYIEVSDDGQGINTKKVYNKAVEKGLIDKNKHYTPDEIVAFIFLPGFSTADSINTIAGRGVGMDVVKTEITNINGKIEIKNDEGNGCRFILKIPINMAAMNGTIVEFLDNKYIIPTVYIKEIVKIEEENWVSIMGKKSRIRLRDKVIPVISVEEIFGEKQNGEAIIIILENEDVLAALPVKSVSGRAEIVVKPIGEEFALLNFISGVSILGDGKASLILDVESIIKSAN